jgi:lysine N6-hydroxylase
VPFLADLVSLTDPTSRYSALNWLRETGRLYSFYFAEDLFLRRREYEAYCAWVAGRLASCEFGARVTAVRRAGELFEVCYIQDGRGFTVYAANVVLGIGTVPRVPSAVEHLLGPGACHSADYLTHRDLLRELPDVTVVGSGQSGAEVVLDLLRTGAPGQRVRWLTRSAAFEPMEYSKLGLEHFTPDYTRYFHSLRPDIRADLLRGQARLHKAISAETIAELHAELHARSFAATPGETGATLLPGVAVTGGERDGAGLRLDCLHGRRKQEFTVRTDAVVFATGYTERTPDFLALDPETDIVGGEPDLDYQVTPGLFVQNAERHSHGVGAPDLGLGAHRAAVILNAVAGRPLYRLPGRSAHTAFDPAVAAAADPGIRPVSPAGPEFP